MPWGTVEAAKQSACDQCHLVARRGQGKRKHPCQNHCHSRVNMGIPKAVPSGKPTSQAQYYGRKINFTEITQWVSEQIEQQIITVITSPKVKGNKYPELLQCIIQNVQFITPKNETCK